MANRERGEVEIQADGKTYTLKLDVNAMVALEELFSTPQREMAFAEIWQRVQAGSLKYVRGFLWAMLQHHHAGLTLSQVGTVLDHIGTEDMAKTLQAAGLAATPDARDVEALTGGKNGAKTARPRKAQAEADGTGAGSISPPAVSA